MEERKDTFHYTYSARQQKEIENIRKKYLPREENKMELLRRLDRSTSKKGMVFPHCGSYRLPSAGCGYVLHHGLDEKLVYPRYYYRHRGDRRRSCILSAVYPHHQKGTGKAGTADFEADRRTLKSEVTKLRRTCPQR